MPPPELSRLLMLRLDISYVSEKDQLLKPKKTSILQSKCLPSVPVPECSAQGTASFEKGVIGVPNGRKWIPLKCGCEVWDGCGMDLWEEWKASSREGSPSRVLHPWPPAMPRNLNKTPMLWSPASHSLCDSKLGGTWASEAIISGLGFIFLVWKNLNGEWRLHCLL